MGLYLRGRHSIIFLQLYIAIILMNVNPSSVVESQRLLLAPSVWCYRLERLGVENWCRARNGKSQKIYKERKSWAPQNPLALLLFISLTSLHESSLTRHHLGHALTLFFSDLAPSIFLSFSIVLLLTFTTLPAAAALATGRYILCVSRVPSSYLCDLWLVWASLSLSLTHTHTHTHTHTQRLFLCFFLILLILCCPLLSRCLPSRFSLFYLPDACPISPPSSSSLRLPLFGFFSLYSFGRFPFPL